MKNKSIIITTLLLTSALGLYFRVISNGNIRTIEFLSILSIGILTGVLLVQIFKKLKNQA